MTEYRHGNWSFREPPLRDGDVVYGGNFSQAVPDTEICASVRDLTIRGGNWVNVKPQATWIIEGGNWCQVSRSPKAHPEWVERGYLAADPLDRDDLAHRSAAKIAMEITEDEYRRIKAKERDSGAVESVVRIESSAPDIDGVQVQTFERLDYVYEDKLMRTGPEQIAQAKAQPIGEGR